MSKNQTIKVGISVGDPNGIGLELIIKTLEDKNILELYTPVVFGSTKSMNYQAKNLGMNTLNMNGIKNASEAVARKINVVNIWQDPINIEFGTPTEEAGKYAVESFEHATKALKEGTIDVLVTAPFNKDTVQSEGYQFPGHTDYLAHTFGEEALMILTGEMLTVALVTQHIPIHEVASHITLENVFRKAQVFHQTLRQDYYIEKPKIALLGLNPHAGDNGLMGKEEQEVLLPAIQKLNEEGILAFGPYPSDSFFVPGKFNKFDGVLAMYHDQGLIPFKTIHFKDGVNFTAGLSKIRTSPDHGVAYDIAGKGIADPTSFKEAIYKALDFYRNRAQNTIDHSNVLEHVEQKPRKRERDSQA